MTSQLREGIVGRKPEVRLSGEVKCDEVYVGAGHKGHPAAVAKKLGRQSPVDQGVFKGLEVGVGVATEAAAQGGTAGATLERGPQGAPGVEVAGCQVGRLDGLRPRRGGGDRPHRARTTVPGLATFRPLQRRS